MIDTFTRLFLSIHALQNSLLLHPLQRAPILRGAELHVHADIPRPLLARLIAIVHEFDGYIAFARVCTFQVAHVCVVRKVEGAGDLNAETRLLSDTNFKTVTRQNTKRT